MKVRRLLSANFGISVIPKEHRRYPDTNSDTAAGDTEQGDNGEVRHMRAELGLTAINQAHIKVGCGRDSSSSEERIRSAEAVALYR